MYMSTCIHVYVDMYTCIRIHVDIASLARYARSRRVYMSSYVYIYKSTRLCRHVYMYTRICRHVYTYTCIRLHVYIYMSSLVMSTRLHVHKTQDDRRLRPGIYGRRPTRRATPITKVWRSLGRSRLRSSLFSYSGLLTFIYTRRHFFPHTGPEARNINVILTHLQYPESHETSYTHSRRGLHSWQRTRTRFNTAFLSYKGSKVKLWRFFLTTPLQLHAWNLVSTCRLTIPTYGFLPTAVRPLLFFLRFFEVLWQKNLPKRRKLDLENVTSQWRHLYVIRRRFVPCVHCAIVVKNRTVTFFSSIFQSRPIFDIFDFCRYIAPHPFSRVPPCIHVYMSTLKP